jgi:sugar phosphate isomerase/epimerase
MKYGLDHWSLNHLSHLKGTALLDVTRRYGFQGLQFSQIREVDPELSSDGIAKVRRHAESAGLYIEVGVPCFNPHNPSPVLLRDGDGDLVKGLSRHLTAIAEATLDSRAVRCFAGGPGDRTTHRAPWAKQLEDTVEIAGQVAPLLRSLGLKLAFENHADISSYEAIELVTQIGTDVAGVCFDTANAVIALEDPLAAAQRLAPYVIATHLKDYVLFESDNGYAVNARPLGQGVLPLLEIVRIVAAANPSLVLSVEDHQDLYAVPLFNKKYVDTFAVLSVAEIGSIVASARLCERSVAAGGLTGAADVERVPWSVRAEGRLRQSAAALRDVLEVI